MKKGTICKKYTEEEKDFVIKNYKNISAYDISKTINRTKCSVLVMASKLGLGEAPIDLMPGSKFNRLTVIKKTSKRDKNGRVIYECLCDCGKTTEVPRGPIESGHTKSCGCFQKRDFLNACFLHQGKPH